MSEKRQFVRKLLVAPGELADGMGEHWKPIRLYDVSLGGIGLLCSQELQAGAVRMVRFVLPVEYPNQVRAVFRVVRSIKHPLFNGYRIGGLFCDLDNDSRSIIQRYVEQA